MTASLETLARFEKDVKRTDTGFLAIATKVENDREKTSEPPGNIKKLVKKFQDILLDDLPNELPPYRTHQHEIVEELGSKLIFRAPYRLSPTELTDMKKQIEYLLAKGLIRPSISPYGAQVLFTPKPDGSLRMCIDYRALNKQTSRINIRYRELMTCLTSFGELRYFPTGSAVRILADTDGGQLYPLKCFPNSVRIVRVFGNAVRTHQRTGNVSSRDEPHSTTTLDECVVVYLDEIFNYSCDMKQHVEHLRRVLEILRRERFYVKLSKSEFALRRSILQNGHFIQHTRRHAPRRQHNSSFVTSSPSMASQPHSSPTETPSSPASSGRNVCLFSEPNSPCHPLTIRRQTDRPSASTKLWSNSSEQPVRTRSPNGTCTCPF
ncbi:hypothetical protein CLOP_g18526 [Closterium sp. NIES-67]|nr:hypothetical protein CLOP_g18526 [Closterium sp. NIES-67]